MKHRIIRTFWIIMAVAFILASTAAAQTACKVVYTISSQWAGGFGASINIQNTGTTAISNWTLTWAFANGQTVTQLWNGTETQSGANVTVANMSYNGSIPAGGSYSGMGFNGSWNNVTNAIPTSFALNGTACNTTLAATTTTLAASTTTPTVGSSVTLTATVAPATATGAVTFYSGTTSLGTGTVSSGKATLATSFATTGTDSLTAVYAGSTTYATSTSSAVTVTVSPATKTATTTALAASTTTPTVGASVTLTATVTPATATGAVTFYSGTTSLGTGTLSSGVATLATSFATAGSDSLTAVYAGSTTYATSTSSAVAVTVSQATKTATTTALAASTTTPTVGASVTLTATVTPATATGAVTFYSGTTSLGTGTLSSGVATLATSFATTGTDSLTAVYAGSTTYATSTSSAVTVTVSQATKTATTTALAASTTTPTVGASVTLTATVAPATATGAVTFYSGTTSLGTGTLSSGKATLATSFATAGSDSLTAVYAGSTTYATSTSSAVTVTVSPGTSSPTACNVVYTITQQGSGVFGATIALDNTGTTAWTNWTLQWIFANGQTIQSLWNGVETQTGALVTVTNENYNGSIAAGGSVTNIGFNGNIVSGNAVPTAFAVNGYLCAPLSGAPPLAPTGPTATSGNQQIALTWTPSLTATSYLVKRSTTSGGPYTTVGTSTTTSYTDTGLTNGTVYYYVVAAVNTAGGGANSTQVFAEPAASAPSVTIIVNPAQTQPISPYIYGIDATTGAAIPNAPNLTIYRMGGNRWTAYNWETNASNAGSDYLYENDGFLSSSTVAGAAVLPTITANMAAGQATLMTVPMQGLVSGDEAGSVSVTNPPDLTRFKTLIDAKSTESSAPFTTTPVTTDAYVYNDEFVWAMNQEAPGKDIFTSTTTTPTFVDLDNEPELWSSTHLEIQGSTPITAANYIAKTLALSQALKNQFPDMVIFGPSHYGFLGVYNWQSGITGTTPTGSNWFTDMYLEALSTASATYGKPLVDVYDFHWYPEDYDAGSTRVTGLSGTTLSDADMQLIVQAPRNLWDSTFTDPGNSNPWVNSVLGGAPINMLGRLKAKIASEFPSMKLAISEYETGGFNNIAGTVAQADQLGVYASQGVFAAMLWPPSGTYDYELAGFRAFRNFDGVGSNFGDVSLQTTSSNPGNVMVYVSTDSTTPGRVVMVAINRANTAQVAAISGLSLSGTANLYQITAATAEGQTPVTPKSIGTMAVSGSSLTLTLPAYSVTTINVP